MGEMADFEAGFDNWINSTFSSVPANGSCTAESCQSPSSNTSANQQGQGSPGIPSWISGLISADANSQQQPMLAVAPSDNSLMSSLFPQPFFSPADPSGVQLDGFLFEYQGTNPGLAGVPLNAQVDVLAFQEELVDAAGIPTLPGNGPYQIQEQLVNLGGPVPGNLGANAGTWTSLQGIWVDNVGVNTTNLYPFGNYFMFNAQTYSANGNPLSTTFLQMVTYSGTSGLRAGVVQITP